MAATSAPAYRVRDVVSSQAHREGVTRDEVLRGVRSRLYCPREPVTSAVVTPWSRIASRASSAQAAPGERSVEAAWRKNRETEAVLACVESEARRSRQLWEETRAARAESLARALEARVAAGGRAAAGKARPSTAPLAAADERDIEEVYGEERARRDVRSPLQPQRALTPFQVVLGSDRAYRRPANPISFSAYREEALPPRRPATAAPCSGFEGYQTPQSVGLLKQPRMAPVSGADQAEADRMLLTRLVQRIDEGHLDVKVDVLSRALVAPVRGSGGDEGGATAATPLPAPWSSLPRHPDAVAAEKAAALSKAAKGKGKGAGKKGGKKKKGKKA